MNSTNSFPRLLGRFLFSGSLIALIATTVPTAAAKQPSEPSTTARLSAAQVLNLKDFGATGNGVTDDGPALQAALDALGDMGGGTLYIPPGDYAIFSPVTKDFTGVASSITIHGEPSDAVIDVWGNGVGLSLGTQLIIAVDESQTALSLKGLDVLLIHDLTFLGRQEVLNDALLVLLIQDIKNATVQHCEFYGLASLKAGGAIILALRSGLLVTDTAFLGCSANSGVSTSIIQNIQWERIGVVNSKFVDYGNRPEFYSKTPLAPPYSWISIGNAAEPQPYSSRREAIIQNVFLDEGAYLQLSARPTFFGPSALFEVFISRLRMNVNNLRSSGVYFDGVPKAIIERSFFGWSHNASAAIAIIRSGNVVLDQVECVAHANTIYADASVKLTVINSIYDFLDSNPQTTTVLVTDDPMDDPVQFVRQQYLNTLSREPDAAAYHYWTRLLLECGAACSQIREALTAFLTKQPTPKFELTGVVTDEFAAPVSGALVQLTGSQTAMTLSDSQGRYSFSQLATAGSYVLAATHSNFNFPSVGIHEVSQDQNIRLAATPSHYVVSGNVRSETGEPVAGARIRVSGGRNEESITDAQGAYAFNLPAGGDYVITPEKSEYEFSPVSHEIKNLSASHVVHFTLYPPAKVQFSQSTFFVAESDESVRLTVVRSGNTTSAVRVTYETADGPARQDNDYTFASGVLTFEPSEVSKSIEILITDDAYSEPNESFIVSMRDLSGNNLADATVTILANDATPPQENPIEAPDQFVVQQYADFLGRAPDQGGLDYWRGQIVECGTDQLCITSRRVGVSAAFFVESEFQETGGYIYRLKHSIMGMPPSYSEFMQNRGYLISYGDLLAGKDAIAGQLTATPDFLTAFPLTLASPEFIDAVLSRVRQTTGVNLDSERSALLEDYDANEDRARILRLIADNPLVQQAEYNRGFVLMQYFGYLRRDPDLAGYNFWLNVLDNREPGNFRGMVCAFLTSREFQERFSTFVPRADHECASVVP